MSSFEQKVWPDGREQVVDLRSLADCPLDDVFRWSFPRAPSTSSESGEREKLACKDGVRISNANASAVGESSFPVMANDTDPSFAIDYSGEPHFPSVGDVKRPRNSLGWRGKSVPVEISEVRRAKPANESAEISALNDGALGVRFSVGRSSREICAFLGAGSAPAPEDVCPLSLRIEISPRPHGELVAAYNACDHGRMLVA